MSEIEKQKLTDAAAVTEEEDDYEEESEGSGIVKFILTLPILILLYTIDYLLILVTFKWLRIFAASANAREIRSVPVDKEVSHRHTPNSAKNGLATTPFAGTTTMYELAARSFKKYRKNRCLGSRIYLGQKNEKQKEFGKIEWKSYSEVESLANKFGAALIDHGLVAAPPTTNLEPLTTPCSVAIFENTCCEWMIACQGCFTQSLIVTTIYATLGADAVIDSVRECSIRAIVCNKINVQMLKSRLSEMPSLKLIIFTNDMVAPNTDIDTSGEVPDDVTVISFDDFTASGKTSVNRPVKPTPDTCAVIMFTSGSTGKPKGVVVKHSNLLSTCAGAAESFALRPGLEVCIGYLPLAHILELMAELAMMGFGACIGYADPKTLTVTGAFPIGALEQISPTIMAGVPKIWDVIKKGVQAKIAATSPVAQFLVNTAFGARSAAIARGYDTPLFNALVFKKFAKVVGGQLRLALSGGGPLNSEVQIFVRTAFGCPLFQGYGLTETCAGLTIQDPKDLRAGIAGVPSDCCEVKLADCAEIMDKKKNPYLISDRVDVAGNKVFGRGEIWVKGNNITVGYYNNPEATAESYDAEGWFHTGDIGQFMEDGSIAITDRKKNLVKLKGGEYIAIENMEMVYGNCGFVDAINGGICCYGDGDMDRPIALMQLNQVVVEGWAAKNGMQGGYEVVKKSKELMKAVMSDLQKQARTGGLSNLEKLTAVVFLYDPWTPINGCLTAANKLQRRVVIETFAAEFEKTKLKGIF